MILARRTYFKPRDSEPSSGTFEENPPTDKDTQVLVSNLPTEFTSPNLLELFERFGCITSHRVIMRDGKSRGFGFVSFKTEADATKAMKELNGKHTFSDGKNLHVKVLKKNLEQLFVKNLHADVTWKDLYRVFAKQGRLAYAKVIIDERGVNRGYSSGMGTVCFRKAEDAAKAVANLNGYKLKGMPMCVEYFKTKYELKKEKLGKYYKQDQQDSRATSQRVATSRTVVATPNDAAAEKQALADRVAQFVKGRLELKWEKITLLLLDYENSELYMLLNNPNILKRKVQEAASLLTIAELTR